MTATLAKPSAIESTRQLAIGQPFEGGFFAGFIRISESTYALIVAPRNEGEIAESDWIEGYKDVPNAKSYNDGLTNTTAMAEAGSELAKWATGLAIGGHADWYIPSQDELEICYRNLKPTAEQNTRWVRSGINISAVVPTPPYALDNPTQTSATSFQPDGNEAFTPGWYWSSTQHAADSGNAWCQNFLDGGQGCSIKSAELRARAVRRLAI